VAGKQWVLGVLIESGRKLGAFTAEGVELMALIMPGTHQ
jgi:hypothetical protein